MHEIEFCFKRKESKVWSNAFKLKPFRKIFVSISHLGLVLTGSGTPALDGVDTVEGSGDFGVPGVLGVGVLGG